MYRKYKRILSGNRMRQELSFLPFLSPEPAGACCRKKLCGMMNKSPGDRFIGK